MTCKEFINGLVSGLVSSRLQPDLQVTLISMGETMLTTVAKQTWGFLRRFTPSKDHFGPHTYAPFEGYYSRTQLDDGGTLAVIFCWVKNAPHRANLVHLSYTPARTTLSPNTFKYEVFPDDMSISTFYQPQGKHQPFTVEVKDAGTMELKGGSIEYRIRLEEHEVELNLRITEPTSWSHDVPLAGPMGLLTLFSRFLPLNWHVFCTSSQATYTLRHRGKTQSGTGISHVEKNWGSSFPSGWIWSQSFASTKPTKSLALAGGVALPGIEAYLVGYRSPSLCWDFRPPFAMGTTWFSPFMSVHHDSKAGTFRLTVQTFRRKLVIKVNAPVDSFIGLAAPLADGHHPMFAFESFVGATQVEAWGRAYPWQSWILLEEGPCGLTRDGIPCSALEFGGTFSHLVSEHPKSD